jgi:hypothetical protein
VRVPEHRQPVGIERRHPFEADGKGAVEKST